MRMYARTNIGQRPTGLFWYCMRDYRQILFGPPELDNYLANNTKANLKEIEFFRNTMTPEVAEMQQIFKSISKYG